MRIVLNSVHPQPGLLDRRHVVVHLHGAADAGCPKGGITGNTVGKLGFGDDVGNRQPPAGSQQTRRFLEHPVLVRHQVDHPVADERVEGAVVLGHAFDVPLHVGNVFEAGGSAQAFGFLELRVSHVHTDHLPGLADVQGGHERVHARSASQIDYRFPFL